MARHCLYMVLVLVFAALGQGALLAATTLIWPENRTAYYADESVEIAVAGLDAGQSTNVRFIPVSAHLPATGGASLGPITFPVVGDGSTVTFSVPAYTFAPATYAVNIDGSPPTKIVISSGIRDSTFLISQTQGGPGCTFAVGNSYGYGLIGPDGLPMKDIRGKRSQPMQYFDDQVAKNMPTLVYSYWTGYVTHKPFGVNKSYVDPAEVEEMRLLNFATAEHLRRYNENILSVCTIDEPGLQWGRTPIDTTGSGFPDWDEQAYYEAHGWTFSHDPGSRADGDYLKYVSIRCGILRDSWQTAKQDLKTVWPQMVFSTDCYAPSAIMDGTDPMNQVVNDIPASHVFIDWGRGRMAAIGTLYLEKCACPTAKLAHAMNGQLFGKICGQPNQRDAYRLTLNAMLAAGLASNWWLNTGGMTADDLLSIDEPAERIGPLFNEFVPADHDIAILFSHTELALREKPLLAAQAQGKQLSVTISNLPANTAIKTSTQQMSAYNVGSNYDDTLLLAHAALNRAGYAAQFLHEDVLGQYLKNYRVLLIIGQTHSLPGSATAAISDFIRNGGVVLIDKTSTATVPGARVIGLNAKDTGFKWSALFSPPPKTFKTDKESSYFQTNYFMDTSARLIVPFIKEVMHTTKARPVISTDSTFLGCERHVAGEGALYMVLNGFEQLPAVADTDQYPVYNYARHEATFTLNGIKPTDAVYCIDGPDWKNVAEVANPRAPQDATFAAGEMKLYLVAPREPGGIDDSATASGSTLDITATLRGVKMPWPIEVSITDPNQTTLFHLYRSMDASGNFHERIPLGTNAPQGTYLVTVSTPAGQFSRVAQADYAPVPAALAPITDTVRVFDEAAIKAFLATKPEITIVTGGAGQIPVAHKLADVLSLAGCKTTVSDEKDVIQKARYPRVWDPIVRLFNKGGGDWGHVASSEPKYNVLLSTGDDMSTKAVTPDGKDVGDTWRRSLTMATIVSPGFIDYNTETFYAAGCKIYIPQQGVPVIENGITSNEETTAEFRETWSRPWAKLTTFIGTDKVPPQLPEAYRIDQNLIVLGDSDSGELAAALQASEILPQTVDGQYPGAKKALIEFARSPFYVGRDVVFIGAADDVALSAGADGLANLAGPAAIGAN